VARGAQVAPVARSFGDARESSRLPESLGYWAGAGGYGAGVARATPAAQATQAARIARGARGSRPGHLRPGSLGSL